MDKKIRRVHTPAFKAQVVLAMLKSDKTRGQIATEFGIHPTQADKWKQKALAALPTLFTEGAGDELKAREKLIEELYRQLGKLKYEAEWLKKKIGYLE